ASDVLFFFSSRRRHTRLQGDWSSDVCSSDLDHGRHFAFFHSWPDVPARVFHADRGQFIGKTHALDFLRGFDHAHFGKQRCSVDDFAATRTKRIVITLPVNRRLPHHAIANL